MKSILGVALIALLAVSLGEAQTIPADEQELIKLENDWNQAVINRDAAELARFYANEYVYTDPEGEFLKKDDDIANIASGSSAILSSFKLENLRVRVYGEVAVVTGRNNIKGVFGDIKRDISGPYRFTDVFVKRDGRWQCVASQSSRVTGEKATS